MILGIAMAIAFAAKDAAAEYWIRIHPDNEYAIFDADSLRPYALGMILVRMNLTGRPRGRTFEMVVNCRERSSATKEEFDRGQPMERPPPDTIGADLVARVCR